MPGPIDWSSFSAYLLSKEGDIFVMSAVVPPIFSLSFKDLSQRLMNSIEFED